MNPNAEVYTYRGTTIRKERRLPLAGQVLVSEGDTVQPSTVIARTEVIPGDPYVLDLKAELKIKDLTPEVAARALLKKLGDRVQAGEPVARLSKGFFGETAGAKSPVDGVIEFVSAAFGRVLIREDARSAQPMITVNVARDLDVWPAMIRAYMRFREGQQVTQGEVIAAGPGAMGMDYSYAPAAGTIERIDVHTGIVYIVRPTRVTEVDAFISGTVERIIPDLGAVIVTPGVQLAGVFGLGGECYGEIMVVTAAPSGRLEPGLIYPEAAGKLVVGGGLATIEAIERAAQVGVRGVITGSMHQSDLVKLRGAELGAGITGLEDLGLSLILTEGFGTLAMAQPTFDLLRRYHGKPASMSGRTQVRAGAVRPEVLIPVSQDELQEVESRTVRPGVLQPGARVRVVRGPHFGLWGTVVSVPVEPHRLETEAELPVVEVRTDSGESIIVARVNVESHGFAAAPDAL